MELRKHELTREYRKSLRDKAREGISEEDLRITDETLEKMAKNLGWDESQHHGFHGRPFGFRRHGMMRGFRHGPHPLAGHGHDDHPMTDEPLHAQGVTSKHGRSSTDRLLAQARRPFDR